MISLILFLGSGVAILTTWFLYPFGIFLLAFLKKNAGSLPSRAEEKKCTSKISVIIAAYNEQDKIQKRIKNIVSQDGNYDIEIIIGSDGSTDNTVQCANDLNLTNVKVCDFRDNRGRATVHNDCSEIAEGEILLFTDAETRFSSDFLSQILHYFEDGKTGCVSGRIMYTNENRTDIGRSAGLYWKYEEMIRVSENRLGILAFGTGAAIAIRKSAYRNIGPTEDIDYAATLNVAAQGYEIKYEPDAKAYDFISETSSGAFNTRIRQTSRCFKSVVKRIFNPLFVLNHPTVFFAALFHKTFRHLTPYFMLILFFGNIGLLGQGRFFLFVFFCQLIFYFCSLGGFVFQNRLKGPLRYVFSLPYNFLLINISRFIGVLKAIKGNQKATYTTSR